MLYYRSSKHFVFQSTLSVRRATMEQCNRFAEYAISIHALREESDFTNVKFIKCYGDFNPRSP